MVKEKYEQVAFDETNGLVYCIDKQEEIELVSVFIDNTEYELYPNKTFAEQGYEDIYKEVEGEDIDCADEYPEEGVEYWTT